MNRGASAVSPSASRICRMQKFRPCSKSTNVSPHQTCSRISLRVTISPPRRASSSSTLSGCGASLTTSPWWRSSPGAGVQFERAKPQDGRRHSSKTHLELSPHPWMPAEGRTITAARRRPPRRDRHRKQQEGSSWHCELAIMAPDFDSGNDRRAHPLSRVAGRLLGRAVLAPEGLHAGLHHGAGLHGAAEAGIRQAQHEDHRPQRRPGRRATASGPRTSRRPRATRRTTR